MSGYFVSCETVPTVDSNGVIYCTSPVIRETPNSLIELSQSDVNEISEAVLFLFVTAYLFRMIRQFIENKLPGRY